MLRDAIGLGIISIIASIVFHTNGESTTVTLIKNSEGEVPHDILKNVVSATNNVSKNNERMDYWMARMGNIRDDLINVQAIIVKDEDVKGACDPAQRKSNKRYLMCAGSILNRNHVLTSASCIHEATHIRHNIRSPLAVVVAPLKPSIQVIRVVEYKIHPNHHSNPYSRNYVIHNLAILTLSCRIEMENYFKVDLPVAPFVQTCSEDNCVVAIYRKTGPTSNVMFQMLAPNIPFPNRRRKETLVEDVEIQNFGNYKKIAVPDDFSHRSRQKRKLAEPPIFVSRYEPRKEQTDLFINSTTESFLEYSTIDEKSAISLESHNRSDAPSAGFNDDEYRIERPSGNETIKSFVRRSSNGYRSCPHTGAAVMANRTQAAVTSVPCDDRQQSSKWLYTDIWDNVDWIHTILQDWGTNVTRPLSSPRPFDSAPGQPGSQGNYSGCSTCIFNFFIEIGCKDKNRCGNKSSMAHEASNFPSGAKNNNQGCNSGNAMGIEIGIGGQGCEKKETKIGNGPEYRGMSGKHVNLRIGNSEKREQLPSASIDSKMGKSVTDLPSKTVVKHNPREGDKFMKKDSNSLRSVDRPSSIGQTYKTPTGKNTQRDRATNEIGSHNIDGDSPDWSSEVEKGLEMNFDAKRESVDSGRSS